MNFRFTVEQEQFRSELKTVLTQSIRANANDGWDPAFSKALAAERLIGIAWPKQYGGRGLGPVEQMIYTEEMIHHRAPRGYHFIAERQVGPSIARHGTEEQKAEWLGRILNADVSFALGLSEPGAGSDLASVTTRAARDGDDYVVDGQKIWTSGAHRADAIWLVVRTNPAAPKHRGISCLLVDLKTPGITIRPIADMSGQHHFNEVFFSDVRVPLSRRVGEEDRGWYVLAEHLDFERSGIERLVELEDLFRRSLQRARETGSKGALPGAVRVRLAQLAIELEVGRQLCYRVAYVQSRGGLPNAEASMAKIFGTEWCQRAAAVALAVEGLSGAAAPADAEALQVQSGYLNAVSRTIAGGTSEVNRNILATRGLGFPRA